MGANSEWEWAFPAAGVVAMGFDETGEVIVKVVCDQGFGNYKTLKAALSGVRLDGDKERRKVALMFIRDWCQARAMDRVLVVRTRRVLGSADYVVHLYQNDSLASLADALEEQGLAHANH